MIDLFIEYKDVWDESTSDKGIDEGSQLAPSDLPTVSIPVERGLWKWHEGLGEQERGMLEDDVIELSTSSGHTHSVLVQKKDGSLRFAVDYRSLNETAIPGKLPLPKIEDMVALTEESRYFCLLDLRAIFRHIPIRQDQREIITFNAYHSY